MRNLLFFLTLFIASGVQAKEYPMLHYTLEDGLPSNTIYDIYQDPDGIIWIGTDKGLAKYNGQKFETYTTADGLADNECFYFRPDLEGRLWLGSFNGDLCFYKDGKFHTKHNTPWLNMPFRGSLIKNIQVSSDSSLTIFHDDVPGFIEINHNRIKTFKAPFMVLKYSHVKIVSIKKKSNNHYDLYYNDEVISIDSNSNITHRIRFDSFKLSKQSINGNSINFITTQNEILSENLVSIKKASYNNIIYQLIFESSKCIISTNRGVYIDNNEPILSDRQIHKTIQTREGNYWMGTSSDGIFVLNKNFSSIFFKKGSIQSPVVFAQKDTQQLIFSTQERNAYRMDLKGNIDCIFEYKKHVEFGNELSAAHWIANESYYNCSYQNNFLIKKINSKNPSFAKKIDIPNLWGVNGVYLIGNYIYLKSRRFIGIVLQNEFNKVNQPIYMKEMSIGKNKVVESIYGAALDASQTLWFSSLKNLYKVKDSSTILQPQFGNLGFREFIFSLNFLIGNTHHNQLLITNNYDTKTVLFDTIKSNDCVWDKFYSLNDSTLLISTNNYYRILSLFPSNPKLKYSLRVLENPFLPYQPEFLYVNKSNCYFFKKGAIISYPINLILEKESLPTLKFLNVVAGKNKHHINKEVALKYFESQNINIQFSPISFNHKNLRYEYSISSKNKEDNWIAISGEELNLVKIGFGNFVIKVRAKTMSGEYTSAASFILTVGKPYWATWWFIGLILLIAIFIIAYASRLGVKRSLKKKENEVRFLRSEYKALNALMNPHFIFNSLNSVQSLVNNNENVTASKYIRIFSDLIRQNMRNISQDLISLSKEMNLVENYLKIEQLRFKEKLNYNINIDEIVEGDLIMIPPLLIQPLVENAVKHGIWPKKTKDGLINIDIYEEEDILFIAITDNGIGISTSAKSDTLHESYAMSNIHKRIEHLSQIHQIKISIEINETTDESGKISGVKSLVKIELPNTEV